MPPRGRIFQTESIKNDLDSQGGRDTTLPLIESQTVRKHIVRHTTR